MGIRERQYGVEKGKATGTECTGNTVWIERRGVDLRRGRWRGGRIEKEERGRESQGATGTGQRTAAHRRGRSWFGNWGQHFNKRALHANVQDD